VGCSEQAAEEGCREITVFGFNSPIRFGMAAGQVLNAKPILAPIQQLVLDWKTRRNPRKSSWLVVLPSGFLGLLPACYPTFKFSCTFKHFLF